MNHNAVEERSILAKSVLFQAERMRLAADTEIASAHAAAVAAHRFKIAALLDQPEFARLYGEITGDRLKALSRMLGHFGTAVFLKGPSAVPVDFHLRVAENTRPA